MSHLLSEPDSHHTSTLTGPAAHGYRPAPSAMSQGSTHDLKQPVGGASVHGPIQPVEPQHNYHDGNAAYTHPDMPSFTPPAHSTHGEQVTHTANYWQKIAEANAPPNSPSIEEATAKATHGNKLPKGI